MAEKRKEHNGLKKLRKETGEKPKVFWLQCRITEKLCFFYILFILLFYLSSFCRIRNNLSFYCENCKRHRYSECTCIKGTKEEG